jgi:hypothetical protein
MKGDAIDDAERRNAPFKLFLVSGLGLVWAMKRGNTLTLRDNLTPAQIRAFKAANTRRKKK